MKGGVYRMLTFILERGMRTPSLEKNKSVLTNLINYERQSINEKAQITQGAFDSFVCGCTHAMDPRTNCSFNSQDNSWSGNQEHQITV